MGEVYRAEDPRLGRTVAIKVLSSDRVRKLRFTEEFAQLYEELWNELKDEVAGTYTAVLVLVDGAPTVWHATCAMQR